MKTKVVYIVGAGRSGSTALGIALGNVRGGFYAGEVFSWVLFRGVPRSERPEVQAFWQRVLAALPTAENWFEHDFHTEIEHPRALLHPFRFRDSERTAAYRDCFARLFEVIRAESDSEFVIDSSHYPLRLWKLRGDPRLDIRVVHLVRDPRSVVNALRKPIQRSAPMHPLQAILYCWTVWLLSSVVYLTTPRDRRIRIRYEDFVREPVSTAGRITDMADASATLDTAEDLLTGPVFQGNRLREKERISIRPMSSQDLLGRTWRCVSTILLAPLVLAHGYRVLRRESGE